MKVMIFSSALALATCMLFASEEQDASVPMIKVTVHLFELEEKDGDTYFGPWRAWLADAKSGDECMDGFINWTRHVHLSNLLSAPTIVSRSGDQAKMPITTEILFATQFDLHVNSVTNGTYIEENITYVPRFSSQNVGVILYSQSTWNPQNEKIDLDVTVSITELVEWNNDYKLELPIFSVRKFHQKLEVSDGVPVLIGQNTTKKKRIMEDRVPVLWRISKSLFTSTIEYEVNCTLFAVATARLLSQEEVDRLEEKLNEHFKPKPNEEK